MQAPPSEGALEDVLARQASEQTDDWAVEANAPQSSATVTHPRKRKRESEVSQSPLVRLPLRIDSPIGKGTSDDDVGPKPAQLRPSYFWTVADENMVRVTVSVERRGRTTARCTSFTSASTTRESLFEESLHNKPGSHIYTIGEEAAAYALGL